LQAAIFRDALHTLGVDSSNHELEYGPHNPGYSATIWMRPRITLIVARHPAVYPYKLTQINDDC